MSVTTERVEFEQWYVSLLLFDRHCGVCLALEGKIFEAGKGPIPPLHPNCGCRRLYHHTEYRLIGALSLSAGNTEPEGRP